MDARVWNGLGVARDLLGDAAGAQDAYRSGLEAVPDDPRLLMNYGLSLALTGQAADAMAVLDSVARLSPATPRQDLSLALAYGLVGDTERAAQLAATHLDDAAIAQSLAAYARIRALPTHASKAAAIGAYLAGAGPGG